MPKIRVLVVDDSAVVRRLLTIALSRDPEIEVAGIAANGRIGLARIAELTPDLVTLDVEMPEMDGLQTLSAIRQKHPTLPVIMFSSLTERGASVSINALLAGANDYLAKPNDAGSLEATAERVRAELVPKIKALIAKKRAAAAPAAPSPSPAGPRTSATTGVRLERTPLALATRIEVCTVGTSTGGPNALVTLLRGLPRDLPVPLLIVQHMPPLFTRYLSERLSATTPFPVAEARDGVRIAPGEVWIAPGDFHLEVVRGPDQPQLRLHQGAPENFCRPAVDVLFRSAAACFGAGVLAVVLTGMGQDGLRGCSAIQEAGGQILVQDEATSVVWGMPGAVAGAGLAQATLPLADIAPEMQRRLTHGRIRAAGAPAPAPSPASGARRMPG